MDPGEIPVVYQWKNTYYIYIYIYYSISIKVPREFFFDIVSSMVQSPAIVPKFPNPTLGSYSK